MAIITRIFLISMLILVIFAENATAYIDPGSGSLMIQLIIAWVIGTLFYFRKMFASVISHFRRQKKKRQEKQNGQSNILP